MAAQTLTQKLFSQHVGRGRLEPGEPVELWPQQTLTPDGTGVVVLLELESLNVDRIQTKVSVQYVDHNLLQEDHKNADDHIFLRTAASRYGLWYSPAGNGISHVVHQERFGQPGDFLLGADSHTPAAGAISMLALGAGGLEIALAMAGHPARLRMPETWGIELTGSLPPFVSAKDVILELLRRHGVAGGTGRFLEYHGPGVASLSVMDRHVICNMGTELGAVSSVFPHDQQVDEYLALQGRRAQGFRLEADPGARFDHIERIDLDQLEPLIALPSSPGKVVPVHTVDGDAIGQAYLGSSANPGFRDFAVPARMLASTGRRAHPTVSLDVNPSSRRVLRGLVEQGDLLRLLQAGARLHQTGCNGCVGMGQAPATDTRSLRTTPRNFPGRSGSADDQVYLASPETVTASAIVGRISDPREFAHREGLAPPRIEEPALADDGAADLLPPAFGDDDLQVVKGPNIVSLPDFDPLPATLNLPIILITGDDVSTDEILPAGTLATAFRANVPATARFAFSRIDETYPTRAHEALRSGELGHAIVGGRNFGQGSAREHAALTPRYLGLRAVVASSIARVFKQNLVNFGILPLTFLAAEDRERFTRGARLRLSELETSLRPDATLQAEANGVPVQLGHRLSEHQITVLRVGGAINHARLSMRGG